MYDSAWFETGTSTSITCLSGLEGGWMVERIILGVGCLSSCSPLCPCSPQAPCVPVGGWSLGCCCCVIGLKLDAAVHLELAWPLTARSLESSSHLGLCASSLSGC